MPSPFDIRRSSSTEVPRPAATPCSVHARTVLFRFNEFGIRIPGT